MQTDATTTNFVANNVGSCCVHLHVAKILAGFKLCATTLVVLNCKKKVIKTI